MLQLLSLFEENNLTRLKDEKRENRKGTFVDNIKLPIHRWFRYSAGFSAEWVKTILKQENCNSVLDPFAGSGTVNIAADELGISSFGFEAQPFVYQIAKAKTFWDLDLLSVIDLAKKFLELDSKYPYEGRLLDHPLLSRCFKPDILKRLLQYRMAWEKISPCLNEKLSAISFLAITAILRSCSHAGTAQWQYIQPNKVTKAINPDDALRGQFDEMISDMKYMQTKSKKPRSIIYNVDCRLDKKISLPCVDLVVTSPPYANNYDYADATRFEMTFWGQINGWGDLHEKVRKNLICSSSQHAAKEKVDLQDKLSSPIIKPIYNEIKEVCKKLSEVRVTKGGKKHYHTMIASYFIDMAKVINNIYKILKPGSKAYIVIGDSAPYGVYVPVDKWFSKIALDAGFKSSEFEKIRDRNIKWKNRKHNVLLKEGTLCLHK